MILTRSSQGPTPVGWPLFGTEAKDRGRRPGRRGGPKPTSRYRGGILFVLLATGISYLPTTSQAASLAAVPVLGQSLLAEITDQIARDGLPVLILVTLIILFILAVNTFGKRETFLEAQVNERTRQINQKNIQIMEQAQALNLEKEKVERVNQELMTMLSKLESSMEQMNLQRGIIEEANRKMLDSIRYAKRIQRSILPGHHTLREMFPDSFVFYQARDIVSGDFYFSTRKNTRTFLAAVDCTGHGVPGAFMSLIAHQQLTRAINEYGILEPGRILHWAEKGLSSILSTSSEGSENGDGMEIGLIAFDSRRGTMEYAGAQRPLYRIHQGQFMEYRGEPFSIGPLHNEFELDKRFTNHTIEVCQGDMFYLFSDGFPSQISSLTGKKYMTSRFKEFLLTIHHLDVEEQKAALDREYNNWRGSSAQLDDLLVLGFRIGPTLEPQMAFATGRSADAQL